MSRRSNEIRQRDSRVLRISLGIAVVLHIAALGLIAWSKVAPTWRPDAEAVRLEEDAWTGTHVAVFFGPPRIVQPDGTLSEEPPDRILEAARVLRMPPICMTREIATAAPGLGEVRLTVNARGRIDAVALTRSTGDACWDQVATRVAGDLWYRWLPDERFPAPLELLQPLTVGLAPE
jgi:hypothetical protein